MWKSMVEPNFVVCPVKAYTGKPLSFVSLCVCVCVCVCMCMYIHITDACIRVVPTHNYSDSKQASYRIMTMDIYAILNKAKHNTANTVHLILAAVTWPTCRCGNSRHIWPIPAKIGVKQQINITPPPPTLSNLTRIRPMQGAVKYADRWTDSHDEGSRHFRCLCERA